MTAAASKLIEQTPASGRTSAPALWAIHALGFYMVGKMFYAFGGGSVQPADVLLGTLAIFMTPPSALRRMWAENKLFFFFVAWVISINIFWSAYLTQTSFLTSASYYVFNFLVVSCAFATRSRDPDLFDKYIANWILLSIAIQFAVIIAKGGSSRGIGTFNNPNQLSYWSVCALSILLVVRRNQAKSIDLPFQLMALWCQISSASRAGFGAGVMLFLIWAFFALETPLKKLFGILGLCSTFIVLFATPLAEKYITKSEQFSIAEQRVQKESDESELEVRNYNRIFEYYEYTVFGAGEGELKRFRQQAGVDIDLEIHSSIGTVYFSYGVIGFALFISFLGSLAYRLGIRRAVYLVPVFVYGMTHQGLRFSFFWLLIGSLMSAASRQQGSAGPREVPRKPHLPYKPVSIKPRGAEFLSAIAEGRPGGWDGQPSADKPSK